VATQQLAHEMIMTWKALIIKKDKNKKLTANIHLLYESISSTKFGCLGGLILTVPQSL